MKPSSSLTPKLCFLSRTVNVGFDFCPRPLKRRAIPCDAVIKNVDSGAQRTCPLSAASALTSQCLRGTRQNLGSLSGTASPRDVGKPPMITDGAAGMSSVQEGPWLPTARRAPLASVRPVLDVILEEPGNTALAFKSSRSRMTSSSHQHLQVTSLRAENRRSPEMWNVPERAACRGGLVRVLSVYFRNQVQRQPSGNH